MHPVEASTRAPPALWVRVVEGCQALRGHRLPWLAFAFGTGVGGYFALPVEPGPQVAFAFGWIALTFIWLAWRARASAGFLALALSFVFLGGLVAQARTQFVAGPVLPFRYYGAVEGRVVVIDKSSSGAPRLTLDQVRLDRMAPGTTPRRVRISLQNEDGANLHPGQRVMTTAHLLGPSGPTEPGGFDFQRHAWFLGIGAIGYTRVPLMQAGPVQEGWRLWIAQARDTVADALRTRMPGQPGEVAAAITTGDRSGLSDAVVAGLRTSNLAHLLAISGLHMGLLVGFVFWSVRGGLALIPSIALRYPTRSWAAAVALPFALTYLFLSGGSVATQRAFVMAAVMLIAILLGRRAVSMRSVAIAALLVMIWRPESLTGPGFQMSFAATGALVLAFGIFARTERPTWLRGWRGVVVTLLMSSVVAGLATAPIAALHFNRIGHYGVLANMLAVPMMGFAVMPLLFIGLILMPLGLEDIPLTIAGWGIEWILLVSNHVADLPGSASAISAPIWPVLPILGAGLTVFGASRGLRGRGLGVAVCLFAATLWMTSPRPDVLISDDARLIGVMTPQGRWLSRESGVSFVAESWLENDGDSTGQEQAARRFRSLNGAISLHHAATRRAVPAAVAACAKTSGWLVVVERPDVLPPGCILIDPSALHRTGAVALSLNDDGTVEMRTSKEVQGDRPWSTRPQY